jgi:hypothetical protein
VLGRGRLFDGDSRPNAFMSIPFLVLSVLGAVVFFGADDNPVGGLFVGLSLVYICDFFASLDSARLRSAIWERLLGLAHVATGLWLMYLTTAAVLNFSRGFDLPL